MMTMNDPYEVTRSEWEDWIRSYVGCKIKFEGTMVDFRYDVDFNVHIADLILESFPDLKYVVTPIVRHPEHGILPAKTRLIGNKFYDGNPYGYPNGYEKWWEGTEDNHEHFFKTILPRYKVFYLHSATLLACTQRWPGKPTDIISIRYIEKKHEQ